MLFTIHTDIDLLIIITNNGTNRIQAHIHTQPRIRHQKS